MFTPKKLNAPWINSVLLSGVLAFVGCLFLTGAVSAETGFKVVGTVESLPATPGRIGDWKVSGRTIHVSAATYISAEHGPAAVGVVVEVTGVLQADNSVNATKIEANHSEGEDTNEVLGMVESIPSTVGRIGDWTISGRIVHVTAATELDQEHGVIALGNMVEVKGANQTDGSVIATEIENKDSSGNDGTRLPGATESSNNTAKLTGTVETIPSTTGQIGVWTVSGRKINVTATTRIELEHGVPALGSLVEVKGYLQTDGSINATKIEVRSGSGGTSPNEYYGKIEVLPATTDFTGAWTVGGKKINVTIATLIRREHGQVVVGGYAEVHGAAQTDGSITATEIEVKQNPGAGSYAVYNGATTVSAADYHEGNSSDSIGAAFGNYLASTTKAATTLPLPTDLAGVSVLVDGKPAGLFYVSPTQINYLIPDNTPAGLASVVVLNQGKVAAQGTITVGNAAPSLFTAEQTGQGAPAGFLIRVKSNGQQIRESLSRLDSQNKIVPATIKRSSGDKLFLEVYGTGVRKAPDTDGNDGNKSAESVEATIGGVKVPVLYADVAPGYAGVDQINLEISDSVLAGAAVKIEMKVKDKAGKVTAVNSVVIAIE